MYFKQGSTKAGSGSGSREPVAMAATLPQTWPVFRRFTSPSARLTFSTAAGTVPACANCSGGSRGNHSGSGTARPAAKLRAVTRPAGVGGGGLDAAGSQDDGAKSKESGPLLIGVVVVGKYAHVHRLIILLSFIARTRGPQRARKAHTRRACACARIYAHMTAGSDAGDSHPHHHYHHHTHTHTHTRTHAQTHTRTHVYLNTCVRALPCMLQQGCSWLWGSLGRLSWCGEHGMATKAWPIRL